MTLQFNISPGRVHRTAAEHVLLRILYVTDGIAPFVVGGMQAVSRRHIAWLAKSGHQLVTVHTHTSPEVEIDLPGKHIFVPWPSRSWTKKLSPWRYVDELRAYSESTARIVDGINPDLIYTEGPLLDLYLERPRHSRLPVIFHPHGLEMYQNKGSRLEDAKSFPLRGITRRHATRSDIILSQGGRLENLLVNTLGADVSRIRSLPNCYSRSFVPPSNAKAVIRQVSFCWARRAAKGASCPDEGA